MGEKKDREMLILNLILILLALASLGVAVWTLAVYQFRGGVDDLFMIMACLLLALIFAIEPLLWAYSKGWLRNPFKKSPRAVQEHEAEAGS